MSLDDPSLDPLKWGSTTLGTESGRIGWAMDLTGLDAADGYAISDFETEVEEAFARWEDVANVDFGMVATSDADVVFRMGVLDDGAGLARISFANIGSVDQIQSGSITMDADRVWTPEGQTGGSDFFAVALHEVGHILGLAHIADTTQIMNATVFVDDVGNLDIAAVQELYGDADVPDTGDSILFEGEDPDDPDAPDEGTDEIETSGDDGGGGAFALVLGLFAALMAFFLGGGGAGAAVVAAAGDLDDNDDLSELDDDGLPPAILVHEHAVYLPEDDVPHGHDCGCACCTGTYDDYV